MHIHKVSCVFYDQLTVFYDSEFYFTNLKKMGVNLERFSGNLMRYRMWHESFISMHIHLVYQKTWSLQFLSCISRTHSKMSLAWHKIQVKALGIIEAVKHEQHTPDSTF